MTHVYNPPAPPIKDAPYPTAGSKFTAPEACRTPVGDFLVYSTQRTGYTTSGAIPAFMSHSGNAAFSSCQPTGWESKMTSGAVFSSPGVCPENWVATKSSWETQATKTMTFAYCCKTGDQYHPEGDYYATQFLAPVPSLPYACRSVFANPSITMTATMTDGPSSGQTTAFTMGVFFYPAMRIEWEATSSPTSSSSSSTLSRSYTRSTQSISSGYLFGDYNAAATSTLYSDGSNYNYNYSSSTASRSNFLIKVLIPLGFLSSFLCIMTFWCFRRSKRNARNARLQAAGIPADQSFPPSTYPVPSPRSKTPPPAPAYEAPQGGVILESPPPIYAPAVVPPPPVYRETH